MSFGLTNAPTPFQTFTKDTLAVFLDRYITAYLDIILIYSDTMGEHRVHVRSVLEALSRVRLHLKPEKCESHKKEVRYL